MKYLLAIFCLLAWSCSSDSTTNENDTDVVISDMSDTTSKTDVGTNDDMGTTDTGQDAGVVPGELPEKFSFAGVAYIGHLESGVLQWMRTDGTPRFGGEVDLGEAIIELALDRKNHLLAAALPAVSEVRIFKADAPSSPANAIAAPELLSTISFDGPVLGIKFDPFHERLYAMKTLPLPNDGGPQTNAELYIYDTSDPSNPTAIGTPTTVPTSISWDIDPVRQVLFLFSGVEDLLHGYDLAGDSVEALPGDPIDFKVWYPESNQTAFTVRNLKVDPWSNRIFGARAQGALSELITIEYDALIPDSSQTYSELSSMDKLVKKDDGFDTSVELDDRPFILNAANPIVDTVNGMIWLVTSSWDGTKASYGAMSLREDTLELDTNCGESTKGLMCWYRSYLGGAERNVFHESDGAACVDSTNKVFVGTSYDPQDNSQPGDVHLFQYTPAGAMTRVMLDNSNLKAFPVAAVCH